jgi:IclR family acetate operon transcriptional repressor
VKQTPHHSKVQLKTRPGQGGVQSLARALDLLEAFPEFGPELGLTRIAGLAQINKATAYRLLSTLEERGYVERSQETRKYRLGRRLFELGSYFQNQLEIRRVALAYLRAMVDQAHEAAFLCIREGDEALCIERVESEQQVNIFTLRVGGRQPLHCGAAPRALLTGLDDEEIKAYARHTGLPAFTPHTITSLDRLMADIQLTRERGYAVSLNDVVVGIAAVGAPIYNHTGCVIASISLSGLSSRYESEHITELANIVLATANRLSAQLGFQER